MFAIYRKKTKICHSIFSHSKYHIFVVLGPEGSWPDTNIRNAWFLTRTKLWERAMQSNQFKRSFGCQSERNQNDLRALETTRQTLTDFCGNCEYVDGSTKVCLFLFKVGLEWIYERGYAQSCALHSRPKWRSWALPERIISGEYARKTHLISNDQKFKNWQAQSANTLIRRPNLVRWRSQSLKLH